MKFDQWNLPPAHPEYVPALLGAGLPPLCALVLASRGIPDGETARRLLGCGEELLADPFLLRDMDRAAARVEAALQKGETIAVYGDYDVDGITATCLLTDYLRSRGAKVIPYIPDRITEGYGVNAGAVRKLAAQGVRLIVTVDCGITLGDEADLARELGTDFVVTDHHECKDFLPRAAAVVDPHRRDCPYPFKDLAGVGVALKLVLALGGEEQRSRLLETYADFAAIGTVADVMPLLGENRTLVVRGIAAIGRSSRPGLRLLLREAGLTGKPLTATAISYILSPRINAAGRMGCADKAVELFLTRDPARAEELARTLCDLNRRRQSIESDIYQECLDRLGRAGEVPPAVVLADERWHQGVVGIVASRLSEKYACPSFMICLSGEKGKGSCRSQAGINVFEALSACADLLEGFGGHEQAAGFTILRDRIPAFRARMEEYVSRAGARTSPVLDLDAELEDAGLLTLSNVAALQALEPCGVGNPRPAFLLRGCRVLTAAGVGGGKHLKLRLQKDGRVLDAIFFSVSPADAALCPGDRVDAAFCPQINEFQDQRSVQLQLLDLHPAQTRAQRERGLYTRFVGGAAVTAREAKDLLPSREEFADLWRYLQFQVRTRECVEDTPDHLARAVSGAFARRESPLRIMVCLNVMSELGLICLERTADRLHISVNPVTRKVDLRQAVLMRRLYEILEG